jgi:hypothetical protein
MKYTSDLLVDTGAAAVLALGDNQYYCGGYQAYLQSYEQSWGRVKSITRPVAGNHEYLTSGGTDCNAANAGADGYFRYFGAAAGEKGKGYYSYDIGAWHLIALNTDCSSVGGCGASSPQTQWLVSDLAAHAAACTLAYWHIPLFSSRGHGNNNSRSFWDALYAADADVVLVGHDHIYERFAPQRPDGTADPERGLRQFVVGTGGSNLTSLTTTNFPNSEVADDTTFGVLRLTLHPTSYDWQFVPEAGKTFTDSGSASCHGAGSNPPPPPPPPPPPAAPAPSAAASVPPTAPGNLSARANGGRVDLTWTASSDDGGVTDYQVVRDGAAVGTSTAMSYTDATVAPGTTYTYTVVARDGSSNVSSPSNAVSVTTPAALVQRRTIGRLRLASGCRLQAIRASRLLPIVRGKPGSCRRILVPLKGPK